MTRFALDPLKERAKAAVDAEGLRPFARRSGVSVGVVRSLLDGRDPSFSNVQALATALALRCEIEALAGPTEPATVMVVDEEFAYVPLHEAALAAGIGVDNASEDVIDHLPFRRDWLRSQNVSPSNARLLRARGSSMAPTINDRDMVLVDIGQRDVQVRRHRPKQRLPIYAFLEGGEARMKRVERPEPDVLVLISDNTEYAPEVRTGRKLENITIIGKVIWSAHTYKD